MLVNVAYLQLADALKYNWIISGFYSRFSILGCSWYKIQLHKKCRTCFHELFPFNHFVLTCAFLWKLIKTLQSFPIKTLSFKKLMRFIIVNFLMHSILIRGWIATYLHLYNGTWCWVYVNASVATALHQMYAR